MELLSREYDEVIEFSWEISLLKRWHIQHKDIKGWLHYDQQVGLSYTLNSV